MAQKHTMMMGQITRADAVAACCNSTLRIITTPYYYVTERAGQPAKTEETIGAERNIIWHTGNVNSLRRMRDIRGNGGTRTRLLLLQGSQILFVSLSCGGAMKNPIVKYVSAFCRGSSDGAIVID
jgi:hypothetical protein